MGHVLVTGATGYVGRRLVARLNDAGVPVRALVRSEVSLPEGVASALGDLTDRAALDRACAGAAAVVNLAAVTADRKPPRGGYDRVNATGVASLAAAAKAAGVPRLIQLGGIDTTTGAPGPYLAGRRRGEAAIEAAGIESVAILRPSIMFGGKDAAFVKALARLVKLAPAVPVPGDGRLRLQMVWVDDVVRCLAALVAEPAKHGVFPVGGPDHLTYDDVLDLIGEGLGRKSVRKVHLPLGMMALQAKLAQILPKPPVTPAALELFASDNVTQRDAIEREFGFEPRSFVTHVRQYGLFA